VTTTPARRTRPSEARPAAGRVLVALAAVLVGIVVGIVSLFALPASASSLSRAGNGVGVIHVAGGQRVGPHEGVLAGQGRARAPNYDRIVVGSGVGAEAGPLSLPESTLPTSAEAQQLVQGAEPVGSALKDDIFHRAATFASEDIPSSGSVYRIVGADGIEKTLIQAPGELNNISGRFEWIVNDQGELVHQMFVKGGSINGLPITP